MLRKAGLIKAHGLTSWDVQLPLGGIVGVVTLTDCWPTRLAGDAIHRLSPQEEAFGNWTPGWWAYTLANPRAIPLAIPLVRCRGQQAIPFVLEPHVASQVLDQLQVRHV